MKEVIGSSNRVLEIDLGTRQTSEFTISTEERKLYLGGKGLGLYYLSTRLPARTDALSPENPLILMMGVLLGTNAPCTGRFDAVTKSPLTGIVASSSCGGPFGMALKTAGYEGLILRGKATSPVQIIITPDGAQIEDASILWGKKTHDTQTALSLGKRDGALVIGPAGENLVRYANIMSGERFLGRAGLGAVMGSKNIKAVVARGGEYKIITTNPDRFEKIHKKATQQINGNQFTGTVYRNFGTAANIDYCNDGSILPVNNFSAGKDERAKQLSGQTQRELYDFKPSTCRPCSILCGHKGKFAKGTRQIPEYETLGLMGSNLGIYDPQIISDWNEICGEMGMDTISAGGTLAWAMEATQKGLYASALKFGQAINIGETIQDIAYRRGMGNELANGSRWMAEKYGGMDFAIQVKGMEMPGYDPRGSWGQGLVYAVANRGACHLSAPVFALEVFFQFLNPYTVSSKIQYVKFLENLCCAVNSLQTCLFTAFAYLLEDPIVKRIPKPVLRLAMQYLPDIAMQFLNVSMFSNLLSLASGQKYTPHTLMHAGERILLLERYLNVREGISRKDDTLPERFTREGRLTDPSEKVVPLDPLLDKYYAARGYTQQGIPTLGTLRKHQIQPDADYEKILQGAKIRTLKPRRNLIKRPVVSAVFFILGRALQSLSRKDPALQREVVNWPENTSVLFKVLPQGPKMGFSKTPKGELTFCGSQPGEKDADIVIYFKNLESAFMTMTTQVGTAKAYTEHRISVRGDLPIALSIIRCLNIVERYLFPTVIAKRVIKRLPNISFIRRHALRVWVYVAGIIFGL